MARSTSYLIFVCIAMTMCSITVGHKPQKHNGSSKKQPPNIIIILADDLAWNDVSIHGQNQFYTPNIDALGVYGITLNRHYVAPLCTPSRSALTTGRHGYHTGMFNWVVVSDEPWGMPLQELTLPELLKEAGYNTHLVGKWHLGFFKKEYSPVNRGYDTFNGYLGPYIDYWDHSLIMLNRNYSRGYDMRANLNVDPTTKGKYATDVFTDKAVNLIEQHDKTKPMFLLLSHLAPHTANQDDPMQAPQSEIDKFNYIQYKKRRILAAMISKLDYSVGQVVQTLKKRNMLDNSVILFMSDNGGPTIDMHSNAGSNYPLRGQKDTPWEGAVRGAASIFSPLLKSRERVSNQYIHITDWFKTFGELAGVDTAIRKPNLDGYNVWDALSYNLPSPREETVHNIDNVFNYATFTKGAYKYVEGTRLGGAYDGWLGLVPFNQTIEQVGANYASAIRNSVVGKALSSYSRTQKHGNKHHKHESKPKPHALSDSTINRLRQQATVTCAPQPTESQYKCDPLVAPCLFDIVNDPCEMRNLATALPAKYNEMKARLQVLRSTAVPARNQPFDPNSNPALHDNTWTYWQS